MGLFNFLFLNLKKGEWWKLANLEDFGINEEELTKKALNLIDNLMWFETNKSNYREKYPNKYIAIYKKNIVDSDKDLVLLKERLKERFYLNYILFKFVPLEDMIVIL